MKQLLTRYFKKDSDNQPEEIKMRKLDILEQQKQQAKDKFYEVKSQIEKLKSEIYQLNNQIFDCRGDRNLIAPIEEKRNELQQNINDLLPEFQLAESNYLLADRDYDDVIREAKGKYQTIRHYDTVKIPGIKRSIADMEQKLENLKLTLLAELDKRQRIVNELNDITDLTEEQLVNDLDPAIAKNHKRVTYLVG